MSSLTHRPPAGSYLTPSLEHATVADAMHPGVMAANPDATVQELARMLAGHHVHCVAVIGLSRGGGLGESLSWGIVTDVDVVAGALADDTRTAAQIARHPIVDVEPAMPLVAAAKLMVEKGVSHVLVVDPTTQHAVGVLSTLDIAGLIAWGEA